MRITVIGGTGHIGSFLVPRLVRAGHDVTVIARGEHRGYAESPEWAEVRRVTADRRAQDTEGVFGRTVLAQAPEAVVDLVCFRVESATALVDAIRGEVGHLLHCGSTWRHGASRSLPIAEGSDAAEPPFGNYGIAKDAIARMLKEETAAGGLVTTSIHPGHIVGPGWHPIGPLGNFDPTVWTAISRGGALPVPGSGTETMHHVHADDVAQAFELAARKPQDAGGEDFIVVAPTALSVRGYIAIAAGWFGSEVSTETVSWDRFREVTSAEHADTSWEHLHRSHVFSIEKARSALGYQPAYDSDRAILEAVRWLIEHDRIEVARPLLV